MTEFAKVTVAGNAILGFRVVEESTGLPAMVGNGPVDHGGADRSRKPGGAC